MLVVSRSSKITLRLAASALPALALFLVTPASARGQVSLPAYGVINTIAGDAGVGYDGDGVATMVNLSQPGAVAVDSYSNFYIADTSDNAVRMVSASTGDITTLAGRGSGTCSTATDTLGVGCPAAGRRPFSAILSTPTRRICRG